MTVGSRVLESWRATQNNVTRSSAQAEQVAAVKVCGASIGITPLANDWGIELCGRVHIDSSAATGVAPRWGNRKLLLCAWRSFVGILAHAESFMLTKTY